jgi:uncharacterized protein (DUF302 family)
MKFYLISFAIFIFAMQIVYSSEQNKGVEMFIENESKYGFDETVEKLSSEILESGWKVTHVHDLQETLRKNGKDVLEVKVIETCNPVHAYKILEPDKERIASNMLPCRVSVYTKSDGKTYISRMNAELLAAQLGGLVGEVMTQAFNEIEVVIKKVVKE